MMKKFDLEALETFVMKAIEHGYIQGYFETEDGMKAVKQIIAHRFGLCDKV